MKNTLKPKYLRIKSNRFDLIRLMLYFYLFYFFNNFGFVDLDLQPVIYLFLQWLFMHGSRNVALSI